MGNNKNIGKQLLFIRNIYFPFNENRREIYNIIKRIYFSQQRYKFGEITRRKESDEDERHFIHIIFV